MQLCLVDIASGKNAQYRVTSDSFIGNQNAVIKHILDSNISFRLINRVIRMNSESYLKPWQLQTVMCYAELKYHSNDYQFM